jgi:hypothetical protein
MPYKRALQLAAIVTLSLAVGTATADEKTRVSDRGPLGSPEFHPSAERPV